MRTLRKKFFVILACVSLLFTSLSVFAGYAAKGFGPMNQYYATLSVDSYDAVANTSGSGSCDTYVYGHRYGADTVSGHGSVSASVNYGGKFFYQARSTHWCSNYSSNLQTYV